MADYQVAAMTAIIWVLIVLNAAGGIEIRKEFSSMADCLMALAIAREFYDGGYQMACFPNPGIKT